MLCLSMGTGAAVGDGRPHGVGHFRGAASPGGLTPHVWMQRIHAMHARRGRWRQRQHKWIDTLILYWTLHACKKGDDGGCVGRSLSKAARSIRFDSLPPPYAFVNAWHQHHHQGGGAHPARKQERSVSSVGGVALRPFFHLLGRCVELEGQHQNHHNQHQACPIPSPTRPHGPINPVNAAFFQAQPPPTALHSPRLYPLNTTTNTQRRHHHHLASIGSDRDILPPPHHNALSNDDGPSHLLESMLGALLVLVRECPQVGTATHILPLSLKLRVCVSQELTMATHTHPPSTPNTTKQALIRAPGALTSTRDLLDKALDLLHIPSSPSSPSPVAGSGNGNTRMALIHATIMEAYAFLLPLSSSSSGSGE